MKKFSSCKEAILHCTKTNTFAIAHLYKEEKIMNLHIHDCYEIYYSISGGKQFLIGDQFYAIQPGDVFLINQYEAHHLTQIERTIHERIVIPVSSDYVKQLSTNITDLTECFHSHTQPFSHKLSLRPEEQTRFLYFVHQLTFANGYGKDLKECCAFTELLLFLNQCRRGYKQPEKESLTHNPQVNEILNFINLHITEALGLYELSRQFSISESYLCRIFKASTGMTVNNYITARRICIAKALLTDGALVSEACEKCGYNDYSNFVKAFKRTVGLSPKQYAYLSQ